jgi:hypothetical protein
MAASPLRLICTLISVVALGTTIGAFPASAQGPGRPPKRVAPTLDAVLPMLNAVVPLRSPDGAHLAAVRTSGDHALAYVPGSGPLPEGFDARVDNAWTRLNESSPDAARRLVLVRVPPGSPKPPVLTAKALPASAIFIVGAAGREKDLDIQTVWLEPGGPIDLPAGAVVFDAEGGFLGLVTERDGQRAIMPAGDVLAAAAALAKR